MKLLAENNQHRANSRIANLQVNNWGEFEDDLVKEEEYEVNFN